MPELWKAWKAKSRLPPLSTSPLGISPKGGEIPTFPQLRRRGRMEKWKTKSRKTIEARTSLIVQSPHLAAWGHCTSVPIGPSIRQAVSQASLQHACSASEPLYFRACPPALDRRRLNQAQRRFREHDPREPE